MKDNLHLPLDLGQIPDSGQMSLTHRILCPLSRTVIIGIKELIANKKTSVKNTNLLSEDAFLMPLYQMEYKKESLKETVATKRYPCIQDENNFLIQGSTNIGLYLYNRFAIEHKIVMAQTLWGSTLQDKTSIMNYWLYFEREFFDDVIYGIIYNRIFIPRSDPQYKRNLPLLEASRKNLESYLPILNERFTHQDFIASQSFSWADASFLAHFSCLEYFSEIHWGEHKALKNAYVRLKSRLSFRALLQEKIFEKPPSLDYGKLDY
jgi:glutathione S-transferase